MYAIGSRFSRRAIGASNFFSIAGESSIEPVTTASRVTPAASAINNCASRCDDSTPATASLRDASSTFRHVANLTLTSRTGLRAERLLAIVCRQRVDNRIDCAVEKIVQLMNRHVDAMV